VQAWFNPHWSTQQRGGDLTRFLIELETSESNDYPDLRVESMPRSFRVLLDEPLDANGSIRVDANGSNNQTQMEALAGANGSIMVDANGTVKKHFKTPIKHSERKHSYHPAHRRDGGGCVCTLGTQKAAPPEQRASESPA